MCDHILIDDVAMQRFIDNIKQILSKDLTLPADSPTGFAVAMVGSGGEGCISVDGGAVEIGYWKSAGNSDERFVRDRGWGRGTRRALVDPFS